MIPSLGAGPGRRIVMTVMSADGFIADRMGGLEWLHEFGPRRLGFKAFFATIDRVLMGRTTYEQLLAETRADGRDWPYAHRQTLVLTSRWIDQPPVGVSAVSAAHAADALRGNAGATWIAGGGKTIAFCLKYDLVDEVMLFSLPVFLGQGISVARGLDEAQNLQLQSVRKLRKGVLRLSYRPIRAG